MSVLDGTAVAAFLPSRSQELYLNHFQKFEIWFEETQKDVLQREVIPSEAVFLAYFTFLKEVKLYSFKTLWQRFSTLNAFCTLLWKIGMMINSSKTGM